MSFGSRIRQLRKDHELTLRELAQRVGIDFTYLSKIENDRAPAPSEETIRALAKVLEADADELVLLANKIPANFEQDLLARPEAQVAELYRSMSGKRYSNEEWKAILDLLREKGTNS